MNKVRCMTGLMNDPLDEDLENCCWTVTDNRIMVTVLPGHDVLPNEEFFGSYGDQHWCSTKYPFELLQKAVWRYRKQIDLSSNGCWPHHPMAHQLFNTPYNGLLPFSFISCPCSVCLSQQADSSPTTSDVQITASTISHPTSKRSS